MSRSGRRVRTALEASAEVFLVMTENVSSIPKDARKCQRKCLMDYQGEFLERSCVCKDWLGDENHKDVEKLGYFRSRGQLPYLGLALAPE